MRSSPWFIQGRSRSRGRASDGVSVAAELLAAVSLPASGHLDIVKMTVPELPI